MASEDGDDGDDEYGDDYEEDAFENEDPLHAAVRDKSIDEMRRLLTSGVVSVTAKDLAGESALHLACYDGYADGTRLLLEHGAVLLPNSDGASPFHVAASSQFAPLEVLELLLKHKSLLKLPPHCHSLLPRLLPGLTLRTPGYAMHSPRAEPLSRRRPSCGCPSSSWDIGGCGAGPEARPTKSLRRPLRLSADRLLQTGFYHTPLGRLLLMLTQSAPFNIQTRGGSRGARPARPHGGAHGSGGRPHRRAGVPVGDLDRSPGQVGFRRLLASPRGSPEPEPEGSGSGSRLKLFWCCTPAQTLRPGSGRADQVELATHGSRRPRTCTQRPSGLRSTAWVGSAVQPCVQGDLAAISLRLTRSPGRRGLVARPDSVQEAIRAARNARLYRPARPPRQECTLTRGLGLGRRRSTWKTPSWWCRSSRPWSPPAALCTRDEPPSCPGPNGRLRCGRVAVRPG